ncbi:hypothetical protein CHUAL_000468 [Chamberlinius hualienensis]
MGKYKILVAGYLLLFALSIGYCERNSTTISFITREQVVDIGETVNLNCSVQFGQDYPVLWVKLEPTSPSGPLTLSINGAMIIREDRFALRYEPSNNTYTLQIKNVQKSDVGTYQCQVVINISNKITADASVLVRTPPVIADNSTRSVVVSEGQSTTLYCYASGFPIPRIYWRRANGAILPTGGSTYHDNILVITAINKEFRGIYYCVADNGVGKGTRRNVNVVVEFAPIVRAFHPRAGQALNFDLDILCTIEAYPVPTVVWIKDKHVLANDMHYQISNFAAASEFTKSTLRVVTIENRQYGYYICKAENRLGSNHATFELFETASPVCHPACRSSDYFGAGNASFSNLTIIVVGLLVVYLRCRLHV